MTVESLGLDWYVVERVWKFSGKTDTWVRHEALFPALLEGNL